MFENITKFFKKLSKKEENAINHSKSTAKERLHLVLMQDRANVSADFLELMKQEIIEVIKKYIDVDESAIDVRLTNKENEDGTNGAPALYANIPIVNIKNEAKAETVKERQEAEKEEQKVEEEPQEKLEEVEKTEEQEEKEELVKEETINEVIENKENQEETTEEEKELKSENSEN